MSLTWLPRAVPAPAEPRPKVGSPAHPMRVVTRDVAFDPASWTPERQAQVAALFDSMAAGWDERDGRSPERSTEVLEDALGRGGPFPGDGRPCRAVEVGSGTGLLTRVLATRFPTVVALDVSWAMLLHAPAGVGHRVLGDGAALPCPAGAVDVVVLYNAFLFPGEVDRVLAPGGAVVWASGLGEDTPIYLPPDDVTAALPGDWDGVAAEAGWGTWAVLRRAS